MREIDRLFEVKSTTFLVRRIRKETEEVEEFNPQFNRIQKRIRNWSTWLQLPDVAQSNEFNELKKELKALHHLRCQRDIEYRKWHQRTTRIKRRIIRDALNLRALDDLGRKNYFLPLLHKRWRESGTLFQPYESELWNDFKRATQQIKDSLSKHRSQIEDIRAKSAQLRHEMIQESQVLYQGIPEKEARIALRNLIKKWKEFPQVDVYQEQRFWRWTEKKFEQLFKKSG